MPRRVKTCLRADMNQQTVNHVAILQTNKKSTDKIWLDEANEVA